MSVQFGVLVRRMPVLGRLGPDHRGIVVRRAGRGAALPALSCGVGFAILALANVCVALFMLASMWGAGGAGAGWFVTVGYGMAWLLGGLVLAPMVAGRVYASIALRHISRWIREGSCVACGYDIGSIGQREPCPECGAANLMHAGVQDDEAFADAMLGGNGESCSGEEKG